MEKISTDYKRRTEKIRLKFSRCANCDVAPQFKAGHETSLHYLVLIMLRGDVNTCVPMDREFPSDSSSVIT